jgi:arylsulfatase A-like enzyme
MDLKRGIDKAVEKVVGSLKAQSQTVGNDAKKIEQVASISANNDNEFGKLWDVIIKEKLNEKAVIIITADHGDYIGEHGLIGKALSLYKGCWNVPLFISYPNMNNKLKGKDIDPKFLNLF